jgi:hypothetical protein
MMLVIANFPVSNVSDRVFVSPGVASPIATRLAPRTTLYETVSYCGEPARGQKTAFVGESRSTVERFIDQLSRQKLLVSEGVGRPLGHEGRKLSPFTGFQIRLCPNEALLSYCPVFGTQSLSNLAAS